MEKLEIGQENLHCSVRTMLGFAQGLSLTIAQQEPTTCTLYVIGAGHASSPASGTSPRCNVNIGALQAHNRCFTVAYPGAHLALRCCFKSWPTSQRCARFCPPCDLLDELNPRPWWDAFTRAATRTRTGFSIRNAGGACAQRARPKKACALQGRK